VCQNIRQFLAIASAVTVISRVEGLVDISDEMDQECNRQHMKSFLEEVFCAHSLSDYVIAENSRDDDELVVLKKGDIEQIGLFICMHCSMIFGSAEERSEHLRAHYFV